ncbi:hypothetical protein [Chryseobacterium camelliae]|uniref:hypothetical protein n=1 Tax=Chryseobacterium camelliae TaxID=1265445 RepID=UPI0012FDF4C2|nr:hypothetical protein [Chryseobacterium camelliae]
MDIAPVQRKNKDHPGKGTQDKVQVLEVPGKACAGHQSGIAEEQERMKGIIKSFLFGEIDPEMGFTDKIKAQVIEDENSCKNARKPSEPALK